MWTAAASMMILLINYRGILVVEKRLSEKKERILGLL
jgi:hypothetical protein